MRRVLLCFLLCFLSGMSAAANAEETVLSNQGRVYTGTVTVRLTVEENYTVVIPPSVPLAYGVEKTGFALRVADLDLTEGYTVRVRLEAPEGTLSQKDGGGKIPYAVEDEHGLFRECSFTEEKEYPLSVLVKQEDWFAAPAGSYAGQITFTVSAEKEGE